MNEKIMAPESPAPKKKPTKVSLPPKAIEWAESLAGDTELGVQELLRTAIYRGMAAMALDIAAMKQRNIKVLVEQKLRLSLEQMGMKPHEIESLIHSRSILDDEDE